MCTFTFSQQADDLKKIWTWSVIEPSFVHLHILTATSRPQENLDLVSYRSLLYTPSHSHRNPTTLRKPGSLPFSPDFISFPKTSSLLPRLHLFSPYSYSNPTTTTRKPGSCQLWIPPFTCLHTHSATQLQEKTKNLDVVSKSFPYMPPYSLSNLATTGKPGPGQ